MQKYPVDFNRDRWEGQMNPEERKALYDLVFENKPKTILEIGTARGAGSTYFISSAIANAGYEAEFHTTELNPEFYEYAQHLYDGVIGYLRPFVKFHLCNGLRYTSDNPHRIDLLMLDAEEDPCEDLYLFTNVKRFMPIGSFLVMHDWNTGKTDVLRDLLPRDADWRQVSVTIGLAIYQRVGVKYDPI